MMVKLRGGEGSVGLRVYSNCRSYDYLQFTLSMYSEGSVWVQSAMKLYTHTVQIIPMYYRENSTVT